MWLRKPSFPHTVLNRHKKMKRTLKSHEKVLKYILIFRLMHSHFFDYLDILILRNLLRFDRKIFHQNNLEAASYPTRIF